MLIVSEVQNHALFVVRVYDGTHIGAQRYSALFKAAASAVNKNPLNKITEKVDKLWMWENAVDHSRSIHGHDHHRGFGMRGGWANRSAWGRGENAGYTTALKLGPESVAEEEWAGEQNQDSMSSAPSMVEL